MVVHSYRKSELTRTIRRSEISTLTNQAAAVRTLIPEMGTRLLTNKYAVAEGAAILYTALNRISTPLEPVPLQPGQQEKHWAKFSGCNDNDTAHPTLASCLGASGQYALTTASAGLDPLCQSKPRLYSCTTFWGSYDPQKAVDVAATIYYLFNLATSGPRLQAYDLTGNTVFFSHNQGTTREANFQRFQRPWYWYTDPDPRKSGYVKDKAHPFTVLYTQVDTP